MAPKFENVVSNAIYINKFKNLSNDKLIEKSKQLNNDKFKRYIYKHKGRTIIILITIIILLLCFIYAIPTNGDQDTTTVMTHIGSILGFFASNVFLCLLLTVVGVETYFSRDEFEQLDVALNEKLEDNFEKLKKIDNNQVINRLKNTIKKIKKNKVDKTDNTINKKFGNSEIISEHSTYIEELEDINKDIYNFNMDEKILLLKELNNIINNL